jgi:hypothetical protein
MNATLEEYLKYYIDTQANEQIKDFLEKNNENLKDLLSEIDDESQDNEKIQFLLKNSKLEF